MKEKIKTILIITLFLLLSISVYFNLIQDKQKKGEVGDKEKQRVEFLFSKKRECQELGNIIYNQDRKELDESGIILNPEYAYNEELNTCLYAGGYMGKGADWQKWVKDSLSNKEILYLMSSEGEILPPSMYCDTCVSSIEEFNMRKQELFNQ